MTTHASEYNQKVFPGKTLFYADAKHSLMDIEVSCGTSFKFLSLGG